MILGAQQEIFAYDSALPFDGIIYQDGGHSYFPNSLIFGENLDGVSITGQGMIDGGGLVSDSGPLDGLKGKDEKTKTITNCQLSGFKEGTLLDGTMVPVAGGMGRIKFGTEATGGFRNITISNCTFRNCRGLALEQVDGGIMENITVSNLAMMNVYGYPIYLTSGSRGRGPHPRGSGRVKDLLISGVTATGVSRKSGIHITGLADHPLEGIRLENIRITYEGGGTRQQAEDVPKELGKGYPEPGQLGVMPAYGLFARHVRGLELADVTFAYAKEDFRPAIHCTNVEGLELDNLKAMHAEGVSLKRFENVPAPVIRNSPGFE